MKIKATEAAKIIGITYNTVVQYIITKQMKGKKDGRTWYVSSRAEAERVKKEGIDREAYKEGLQELKKKRTAKKKSREARKKEKEAERLAKEPDISLLTKDEYTAKEVREFLGRGKDYVLKRIDNGELPAKFLGNKNIISKENLIAFVKKEYPEPETLIPPMDFTIEDCTPVESLKEIDAKLYKDADEILDWIRHFLRAYSSNIEKKAKETNESAPQFLERIIHEAVYPQGINMERLKFKVSGEDRHFAEIAARIKGKSVDSLLSEDMFKPFINYTFRNRGECEFLYSKPDDKVEMVAVIFAAKCEAKKDGDILAKARNITFSHLIYQLLEKEVIRCYDEIREYEKSLNPEEP